MSSEKPDQIQASVAAALSRLRGDLGSSAATAPKIDTPPENEGRDIARPANDVRADPFFKSIQSPPAGGGASRGPIPMTPFARMQASQEASAPEPSSSEAAERASEPNTTIEIPPMPKRPMAPDLIPMPEPNAAAGEPKSAAAPQSAPSPAPQSAAAPAGAGSPLARMMRGAGGDQMPKEPAQRDLLAGLPPPPISEPLTGDEESSAMRRRRRNRLLLASAAVIIIVATGVWLWRGGQQSTEVPVIAADATPEKVKPAEEGGVQVPNQNIQVLENMSGAPAQPQAETVMPEPEQPVTPPPAATTTQEAPTVVENTAPEAGSAMTQQVPAVDTPPAPEAPLSSAPLPEQGENAAPSTAEVAPPPSPDVPAPQPAPQATQTAEATEQAPAVQATPEPTPAPAPTQTQSEPAIAPTTKPAATQEAAVTPTVPAGSTRVQLAAGKSEDSVRTEWAALQKAHPDLLGALSLNIERVDKGAAGIFYRLQAGPVADKAAAKKLCASLKQQGQDCIVVMK